jgi:hypothetical protein
VDGQVRRADVNTSAIDSSKIVDGQVLSADIGTGQVLTGELATGAVTTSDVLNDNLTGGDIANNSLKGADVDEGSLALPGPFPFSGYVGTPRWAPTTCSAARPGT